jgi:hypothetical protein
MFLVAEAPPHIFREEREATENAVLRASSDLHQREYFSADLRFPRVAQLEGNDPA